RVADRTRVHSIDLGGQPDSIAISPDGSFAAIAIENQRDEEATPPGGDEGDLPQPPTGFVQLITLDGEPTTWAPRRADFDVDATRVHSIYHGGKPAHIARRRDRPCAAIAHEHQRDEEATPPGGDEGDLPQPPPASMQLATLEVEPTTSAPGRVDFDVEAARA